MPDPFKKGDLIILVDFYRYSLFERILKCMMKFIIDVVVMVVSATGMSEATAPVREFYHSRYDSKGVDFFMIIGMIIGKLF